MAYKSYRQTSGDVSYTVTQDDHTGTKLIDTNNKLSSLASSVAKLEIMVQAMFELMVEKGIDPDLINAKLVEITDRNTAEVNVPDSTKPCPRCGKTVKELSGAPLTGRCMYCGKEVKFYPVFEVGDKAKEAEAEAQPEAGQDTMQDGLGFNDTL